MTQSKDEVTSDDDRSQQGVPSENTRPITITLPDEVLKRLKVIAVVRESSVSELVAEAATGVVKRELRKALSKIGGE